MQYGKLIRTLCIAIIKICMFHIMVVMIKPELVSWLSSLLLVRFLISRSIYLFEFQYFFYRGANIIRFYSGERIKPLEFYVF